MTQFSVQTNEFLNTNKSIYEVVMLADRYGNLAGGTGGTSVDGFGRLRVGEPHTLFESSNRFQVTDKFSSETTGSGAIAFVTTDGCINLSVTTSSSDSVIRETKKVFPYQPGKSLLVMNTVTMAQPQANLTQRVGYFGANNGVYLEQANSTAYIVMRSQSSSATISNNSIAQSDWNIDTFNGTGPSGFTLDLTKSQIFWSDFEWLGVGTVRTGFIIDGSMYIAHQFHHANRGTSTYMTTACLPIRYEIFNTGNTANHSTMKQICSSVISEGGYNQIAATRSISVPITGKTVPSGGVKTPMVSLMLRNGRTDGIVIPSLITMYGFQNTPFKLYIMKDVTLENTTWQTTDSLSSVYYDIKANTVTGGTVLYESIFKGQETVAPFDLTEHFNHTLQLSRDLGQANGNVFSVVVESTTNNDKALVSLAWQEHTI
jgi:hypothetical protein